MAVTLTLRHPVAGDTDLAHVVLVVGDTDLTHVLTMAGDTDVTCINHRGAG